jgi:hypothetical protein
MSIAATGLSSSGCSEGPCGLVLHPRHWEALARIDSGRLSIIQQARHRCVKDLRRRERGTTPKRPRNRDRGGNHGSGAGGHRERRNRNDPPARRWITMRVRQPTRSIQVSAPRARRHVPQRVRTRSRRATEPEVGTVGAEPSLFVVYNSPMTTSELRNANLAQMIGAEGERTWGKSALGSQSRSTGS